MPIVFLVRDVETQNKEKGSQKKGKAHSTYITYTTTSTLPTLFEISKSLTPTEGSIHLASSVGATQTW